MSGQPHPPERLDIDIRFLLANERTLLAWLRTALTLMAGGVALAQLAGQRPLLQGTGVALLGLGSLGAIIGHQRYRSAGRAIRTAQLPAPGHGPAIMTAGVVALAGILLAIYLWS